MSGLANKGVSPILHQTIEQCTLLIQRAVVFFYLGGGALHIWNTTILCCVTVHYTESNTECYTELYRVIQYTVQ